MEVRLVLEGGMFCGLYQVGVLREVRRQEAAGNIRVTALSGTSVGAYLAFAYLTDSLEKATAVLVESRDKFKETGSAGHFASALRGHVLSVGDDLFERRLKTKTLYCSSTELSRVEPHVVSEYECLEDVADALAASSHVPCISGPGWCHEGRDGKRYTDGVFPFIFRDRCGDEYSVMYIGNTAFTRPIAMLNMRGRGESRIEAGEEDARRFFVGGSAPTRFCSYVHTWGSLAFVGLRLKQVLGWSVRCFFFIVGTVVYALLVPLRLLFRAVVEDIQLRVVFGDIDDASPVRAGVATVLAGLTIGATAAGEIVRGIWRQ
jgi:hypothetical protein